MTETAAPYAPSVWREGSRIRRQDGTGYGDQVPDAAIAAHAVRGLQQGDLDAAEFAILTLRLRAQERQR